MIGTTPHGSVTARQKRDGRTTRPDLGTDLSDTALATLIGKTFIARRDVKAIQHSNGSYSPVLIDQNDPRSYAPWHGSDILAHLASEATYGHYVLDVNNQTKLFAFDIDFKKNTPKFTGNWRQHGPDDDPWGTLLEEEHWKSNDIDPRLAWGQRGHPARPWLCLALRIAANDLARLVHDELGIPVAVAYSGNKGLHVYGLTGLVPAQVARDAAEGVIAASKCGFVLEKGKNFFGVADQSPDNPLRNISVEIFPKQTSLDTDGLGNLLRLPLGTNRHSGRPGFFIDLKAPFTTMAKLDPFTAIQVGDPWQ